MVTSSLCWMRFANLDSGHKAEYLIVLMKMPISTIRVLRSTLFLLTHFRVIATIQMTEAIDQYGQT